MSYTLTQSMQAMSALRSAAGLPPESFSLEAVVGMISDEVEAARTKGLSDAEIARLVQESSGIELDGPTLAKLFVPAEARGR
jgi:hypothetical protein